MSDKAYLAALHRVDELKCERDLARRDYECMNKFREAAEYERDQLREALELVLFCDKDDVVYARTKASASLAAIEETAQ